MKTLACICTVWALAVCSASAQSLADMAKKAQDASGRTDSRTSKDSTAKKAYSNQDLPAEPRKAEPGRASAGAPLSPEAENLWANIKAKCAKDWPESFRMREYCQQQQLDGLRDIVTRNESGIMDTPAGQIIRRKCAKQWPNNFRMVNYCEQKELEAAAAIGDLRQR